MRKVYTTERKRHTRDRKTLFIFDTPVFLSDLSHVVNIRHEDEVVQFVETAICHVASSFELIRLINILFVHVHTVCTNTCSSQISLLHVSALTAGKAIAIFLPPVMPFFGWGGGSYINCSVTEHCLSVFF
jgi:hypothetical protein